LKRVVAVWQWEMADTRSASGSRTSLSFCTRCVQPAAGSQPVHKSSSFRLVSLILARIRLHLLKLTLYCYFYINNSSAGLQDKRITNWITPLDTWFSRWFEIWWQDDLVVNGHASARKWQFYRHEPTTMYLTTLFQPIHN
jgi:hypothetical protein